MNQNHPSEEQTDLQNTEPQGEPNQSVFRQDPETEEHPESGFVYWMKKYQKILKTIGVIILVFVAWLLGASGVISLPNTVVVYSTDADFRSQLLKIGRIESIISSNYTGEFDRTEMGDAMLEAMFDSLGDPYSTYYTSDEYTTIEQQMTGTFSGIGIYMDMTDPENIVIKRVTEDGPAEEAGIEAGDILRKIDGTDVSGMEYKSLLELTTGEDGTEVEVTVERDGEEKTFTVKRGEVNLTTVSTADLDGVGYIYLRTFGKGSAEEFEEAVEDLKDEGVTSLVIDLRYNGGGLLDTAVDILDYLLPEGKLGELVDAKGVISDYESDADAIDLPFVVLVNGKSASASEFTAGNIQEMGGTVIGTTTYGKGVAQNMSKFYDGSGYKLTVQEYFVGDGVKVNGIGITPDYVVDTDVDILTSAQSLSQDAQLQKALELLKSGQIKVLGGTD